MICSSSRSITMMMMMTIYAGLIYKKDMIMDERKGVVKWKGVTNKEREKR